MANKNIEQLYQMALKDSALRKKLKAAPDRKSQVQLLMQLGKEKGYDFKVAEVEAFFAKKDSPKERELSDESLDVVAGGFDLPGGPMGTSHGKDKGDKKD